MAAMTSDGSEQESPNPGEQNGDGSESGLRAADPEPAVKMDAAEIDEKPNGRESTEPKTEEATRGNGGNDEDGETEAEPEKEPQKSPGGADGTAERMKGEQREEESASPPAEKNSGNGGGMKRRASLEMMSSISSTLMDMESIASSGRSTPAMMNGHGGASSSSTKGSSYPCCWDQCHMLFNSSPDLAEHIRGVHVDGQRGGVIAKRTEDSGKVKVLLHWTPEDILPDAWVSESDRPQLKTKVVHLSQLPQDTAVLLDPNINRRKYSLPYICETTKRIKINTSAFKSASVFNNVTYSQT
ncbi:hypothetical protein cypCar_00013898 [Cyprinus carpio]|nr:hypothetical protein cypCar_00013898 [Cyprinus carpio]